VVGATGTESVIGTKGEVVQQNARPVTTNSDGQIFDLVSRGSLSNDKVDAKTATEVFKENGTKPVDVTNRQTLTLKLASGGSVEITYERRLSNVEKGILRPSGPLRTGGPTNYTITSGAVTVRRLP